MKFLRALVEEFEVMKLGNIEDLPDSDDIMSFDVDLPSADSRQDMDANDDCHCDDHDSDNDLDDNSLEDEDDMDFDDTSFDNSDEDSLDDRDEDPDFSEIR